MAITTGNFSDLYDQIFPYLPGVQPGIVDSQLRKAVRDFMKRTTLFRETFVFNTVAGTADYRMTPSFGQVSSTLEVWARDTANAGGVTTFTDATMPGARQLAVATEDRRSPNLAPGRLRCWSTAIPDVLSLWPPPDGIYGVAAVTVLTLNQTQTTLPADIVTHYSEAVAAGAISLLMHMPGKPWTQPKVAVEYSRLYNTTVSSLRSKLRDGGQPSQSTFIAARKFGV